MLLAGEADTAEFGARLGQILCAGDVVTLSGCLGAGKTTLARGLLRGLGYCGDVPSPSFPLIIPYAAPDVRVPIWHVDLYRIESVAEIAELALEEACDGGALIIEWPERLPGGRWPGALAFTLEIDASDARHLTADIPQAWEDRWPLQ